MIRPTDIVAAHWGAEAPEWTQELARRCEATSQNRVAEALNVSAAQISQALRNKYKGDMKKLRDRVEGKFMSQTIACPELGNLPLNECRDWRGRAASAGSANMMRVKMFRACNRCPIHKGGEHGE